MGKLAEIKDMEEAVEQENNEAKEFIRFTKRQEEHNQLMEKLMKITAGCAAGVLAVAVIAAIVIVPKSASVLSEAKKLPLRLRSGCRRCRRQSIRRSR